VARNVASNPGKEKQFSAAIDSTGDLEADHLARLAFDRDLERAAANLAIGRESLVRLARVNDELKLLPTEGALDGFRDFHLPA
jgi:hypothetical protein